MKKTTKKKTAKKAKKVSKERKLEIELLWILGFIAVLIVIFMFTSAYFKSLHTIEYEGLTFQKQRLGEIPVYLHTYFFKAPDGRLIKYNLFLRNDPRDLENVTVQGGKVRFEQNKVIFLSIDTINLNQCRYGPLGPATISGHLTDNQFTVKSGNLDFWEAARKKQDHITCENTPGNIVIELKQGEKTQIVLDGKCYKVEVANCEILQASEKLILQSILDSKKVQL